MKNLKKRDYRDDNEAYLYYRTFEPVCFKYKGKVIFEKPVFENDEQVQLVKRISRRYG